MSGQRSLSPRFNRSAVAQNSGVTAKRRGPGRPFPPGVSGNPSGRPREVVQVRDLARQHTEEAIRTLVQVMRSGTQARDRVAASEALLDRAWGRPLQPAEMTGPGGVSLDDIHMLQQIRAMSTPEMHDFIRRHLAASGLAIGDGKGEAGGDG